MPKYRRVPGSTNLSLKQKKFIREYIKTNGNGQESALRAYDVKNEGIARNIASQNLKKPAIKQELEKILQKDNLKLEKITDNIANIAIETPLKGYSGSDILEANKTILKLHGVLGESKYAKVNIQMNLSELSNYELLQLRKKKQQEIDTIIQGEEIQG